MTTNGLGREPTVFRLESKGRAVPEDLAPFSLTPGDGHVLLRDGLRRKTVIEGEVFHWDGLHYVVLSDASRARRLRRLAPDNRGFGFRIQVRSAVVLVAALARGLVERGLTSGFAAFVVVALLAGAGRALLPDGIAYAPAFEHSVRSLDVHRLFHLLSRLPTPAVPPAAIPAPSRPGTDTGTASAAAPPSLGATSTAAVRHSKRARHRDASSDGSESVPPQRYFLGPQE